jgi:crotonobetainyl-CoA hydratase
MRESHLLYEKRDDHIAVFTLNRPEVLNALSPEMTSLRREAEEDFRNDPNMWVGIITGAGRAFCVGRDLKRTAAESAAGEPVRAAGGGGRIAQAGENFKPMIAAINGYALGGGFGLMLSCDIRIMSETAQVGVPESRWNLLAPFAPSLLGELPKTLVSEMLFTAKPIGAQRAYEAGLVNRVVPPDELMPAAFEMARSICENSPLAVRAAKEVVARSIGQPPDQMAPLVRHIYERLVLAEDSKEGPRSFAERRPAQWQGR